MLPRPVCDEFIRSRAGSFTIIHVMRFLSSYRIRGCHSNSRKKSHSHPRHPIVVLILYAGPTRPTYRLGRCEQCLSWMFRYATISAPIGSQSKALQVTQHATLTFAPLTTRDRVDHESILLIVSNRQSHGIGRIHLIVSTFPIAPARPTPLTTCLRRKMSRISVFRWLSATYRNIRP